MAATKIAKTYEKNSFWHRLKKDLINNRGLYALVIPGFILLIIFSYIPMYGVVMAFQNYDPSAGILGSEWIGFENFERFFKGYYFQ